ncbi:hypothetical protein B0T09DRAFT_340818 [Sordaria sp. MPI-SDFR-AT-0083]|nr:hypothetical protein B0T09DRAFT_340818 [Sordaria sp. MPI-SDFR-AT-0083]
MRQFNTPTVSADLMQKIADRLTRVKTAPVEWSTYHQMTNVHCFQLKTLFDTIHGLDEKSCEGWEVYSLRWGRRAVLLKSILLSLASLIFVRTSTTITMATLGTYNYARHEGNKELAAQLVANEGITNLKADCEVILHLITKFTESPSPKPEEALVPARR